MAPNKRNVPFVDSLDRNAHTRACHAALFLAPLAVSAKMAIYVYIYVDLDIKSRLESARDSVYKCRLMQRICQRLQPMHSPNRILHGGMHQKFASGFPTTV